MKLHFVLIAQAVLVLLLAEPVNTARETFADESESDDAAEKEEVVVRREPAVPGIFHFDGSNNGYAQLGEESDSDYDSKPVVSKWARSVIGYSYSDAVTFGMWIKPESASAPVPDPSKTKKRKKEKKLENETEESTAQSSTILQFHLFKHHELQMIGGQLHFLVIEPSGNYKTYMYPGLTFALNEWHFIHISVTTRGLYAPILYSKGLDKAPLDQLGHFVIEEGRLDTDWMKNRTNINNVILGRGFTGKITPVLIGSYYSSTNERRFKECLTFKDQYSSECRGHMTYKMPGSYHLSTYKLSANSNIKMEPYTEITVAFDTVLQCKDFGVSLTIGPAAFNLSTPTITERFVRNEGRGGYEDERYYYDHRTDSYHRVTDNRTVDRYTIDYPVNITLGELGSGCNLTWISEGEESEGILGNYTITSTNLNSCGFQSRREGDQGEVVYSNSVYSHTHSETKKLMDVSCKYTPRPEKKEEVRVSAYVVDEISLATNHIFTPWTLSLHLFSDPSFSKELDLPIKLGSTGENIYVEARVQTNVEGVRATLRVKSCQTHITLNELDEMKRTLIKNSKAVSSSVQLLNSDDSTRKRFMFKADKFEEYPNAMVYLSCDLIAKD